MFNKNNYFNSKSENTDNILLSNIAEDNENIKPSDGEIFYPELYYRDQINLNNKLAKPHNEFKHSELYKNAADKINRQFFPEKYINNDNESFTVNYLDTPTIDSNPTISKPRSSNQAKQSSDINASKNDTKNMKYYILNPIEKQEILDNTSTDATKKGENILNIDKRNNSSNTLFTPFRTSLKNSIDNKKSKFTSLGFNEDTILDCDTAALLGYDTLQKTIDELSNKTGINYKKIIRPVSFDDFKNIYQNKANNPEGRLTMTQMYDGVNLLIEQITPDDDVSTYSNENIGYVNNSINSEGQQKSLAREKILDGKSTELTEDRLENLLIEMGDAQASDPDIANRSAELLRNSKQIITKGTTMSREEVEDLLKNNLLQVSTEDNSRILRQAQLKHPELYDLLANTPDKVFNTALAVIITADQAGVRLNIDKRENSFITTAVSACEFNERIITMNLDEMKSAFPQMFIRNNSYNKDLSDHEIMDSIILSAKRLHDVNSKNKRIAESVMQKLYGNDLFYNLDAGISIAVLKLAGTVGFQVDDIIDEIDSAATIANDKCGSEINKFIGNFIKDHLVDVAAIVGCLATGGAGVALKIATDTLSYAGDAYELKKKYKELCNDPNFKGDTQAIIWEMTKELTKVIGGNTFKGESEHLIEKLLSKININGRTAKAMSGASTLTGKTLVSNINK